MSQETFQSNPVIDEAVALRGAEVAAEKGLQDHQAQVARRQSRAPRGMEEVVGGPLVDLEDGIKSIHLGIKQKRAVRAAAKHFKQNQAAYYDEAVEEDARRSGTEINPS